MTLTSTLIDTSAVPRSFKDGYHVVIIGAGLVGLATASLLREARYKVTILERDAELRTIGAGIQMPANFNRVLLQLGLLDKVKAEAVQPPAMVVHSWRGGADLFRLELDPYVKDKYGVEHLVCHRADLRRILFEDAIARGVRIQMGAKVDPGTTDWVAGRICLHDQVSIEADLIIGADGEHSMCREVLLGRSDPPKPIGRVANRILIDGARLRERRDLKDFMDPPSTHCWGGADSQVVCYTLKGVLNVVLTRAAEDEKVVYGPQPGDIDELRLFFKDWDPRILGLLDVSHGIAKWMLFEPDELKTWVHPGGKLVLVGDAAHATSPHLAQGAAIGMESASVLSGLLSEAKDVSQIPELLKLYNEIRQPRTSFIIRSSKRMENIMHFPDGPLQIERDRLLTEGVCTAGFPVMLAEPVFQEWLWGFDSEETVRKARAKLASE